MNLKRLLVSGLTVFCVSLIVSAAVTLLWNLAAHRAGAVDWETSLRLAILFGIIMPLMEARRGREK
jgi:hypothetical protein